MKENEMGPILKLPGHLPNFEKNMQLLLVILSSETIKHVMILDPIDK